MCEDAKRRDEIRDRRESREKDAKRRNRTMLHSLKNETARERRLLCGAAVVCYSATLTSLAALFYLLATFAMSAAGQQVAATYSALGGVAY
jgi:hypothetical protein